MTGRTVAGIQGTTWWVVDTSHVPDGVDPDEWARLAGSDLTQLAAQVGGTGTTKDWTDLHTLLTAIPRGRWTTYGDVAAAIGSHAVPVGTHLANCGRCPNAWRVLNTKGRVSVGFRWTDPNRTDTAADLLRSEGIRFDGETADRSARMTAEELARPLGE